MKEDIWPPAKERFARASLSKQVNPTQTPVNEFDSWLASVMSIFILVILGSGISFLTGFLLRSILGGWIILWGFGALIFFSIFAAQFINLNIDWFGKNQGGKNKYTGDSMFVPHGGFSGGFSGCNNDVSSGGGGCGSGCGG